MKSKDPKVADEAMRNAVAVFSEEMPTIEKDTQLLCSSLHDASIRRQAAAMLAAIDFSGPEHSKVIVACFPDLLAAAGDPDNTTHTAILCALALTPGAPLSTARNVFVKDLNSPDDRTALLATVGLLKTGGERKQDNERLVKARLDNAADAGQRRNMLRAIGGSGVQSEALLGSSKKFLSDPDPDLQRAAFDAVAATGTKGEVAKIMSDIAASPSSSRAAKNQAQTILERQQAPTRQ